MFRQVLDKPEAGKPGSFKQAASVSVQGSLKPIKASDKKESKHAEDAFVSTFMAKVDKNEDGLISLEEFVEFCRISG
jgi:Ca2+-binding EF-hand superfamily protein